MADCLLLQVFPQGFQFAVQLLQSNTFDLLLKENEIVVENPMEIRGEFVMLNI